MNKHPIQPTILVLVSSGFEEESTVRCMKEIRRLGAEVKLVGLRAGLIVGANGLAIRPDVTLSGLKPGSSYQLIVVPGSSHSTRLLLTDPRTYLLLTNTAEHGGSIAILNKAEAVFVQSGLLEGLVAGSVIFQGEADTSTFIRGLIHLIGG